MAQANSGASGVLQRSETNLAALAIPGAALARLTSRCGSLAVVDLETTGFSPRDGAEIIEIGVLLVDSDAAQVTTLTSLMRPQSLLPPVIQRVTGLRDADLSCAPSLADLRDEIRAALLGRTLIVHNMGFERGFLSHYIDEELAAATYLDTMDLLALTHPDAPDMRLETFTRLLLGSEERHRALNDALDTARIIGKVGVGCSAGEARYVTARSALGTYVPESPWRAIFEAPAAASAREEQNGNRNMHDDIFIEVGTSDEKPVPFDEDAIAAALADEERGKRNFGPGYRVRREQIELARAFARNLANEEVLLAEGGTGVGKSLAYLSAAIPFAMQAVPTERLDARAPVVIATRTKLLQDQLIQNEIAAAARFLGYPGLRALSIKGRANYVCERRLNMTLNEGPSSLLPEDRFAFATLSCAAKTREGELGRIPGATLRRYPLLEELRRRSVAIQAGLCTRKQCEKQPRCPFGQRRQALDKAHLIVANHDLLLLWPKTSQRSKGYPDFAHAIVDEVNELSDIADEAYALHVEPDELLFLFDEIFGRPAPGRRRSKTLLSAESARSLENAAALWRRRLKAEIAALGRALCSKADEFGGVELPTHPTPSFRDAAECAERVALCLDEISDTVEKTSKGIKDAEKEYGLEQSISFLREAAHAFRLAFDEEAHSAVANFKNIGTPFDSWQLNVHRVRIKDIFHQRFMTYLRSFTGVSASLFIGEDAFAAVGDLGIEKRAGERLQKIAMPSPFDYAKNMRAIGLRGRAHPGEREEYNQKLVAETAEVIEILARCLGGRTLGLFTSLSRMRQVGDELALRLRGDGLEIIAPRAAADDPGALMKRFARSGGVLLGAKRFWQGIDIPGDALQAVVIEKLPFEKPTELQHRRDALLRQSDINAFEQYHRPKMLLNLKQMIGRLIRSEQDRGIVVIVEARPEKPYFRRLNDALPPGCELMLVNNDNVGRLRALLGEVGIGPAGPA